MPKPIRRRRRPRRGFSLTEVIMTMTLLAVVLMSLARMTMVVSQRGQDNSFVAKRNFVLIQEANKFGSMPWTTLGSFSTADKTTTAGDFPYTRKLTITTVNSVSKKIRIIIVPTKYPTRTDSVTVYRTQSFAGSPLCVGC